MESRLIKIFLFVLSILTVSACGTMEARKAAVTLTSTSETVVTAVELMETASNALYDDYVETRRQLEERSSNTGLSAAEQELQAALDEQKLLLREEYNEQVERVINIGQAEVSNSNTRLTEKLSPLKERVDLLQKTADANQSDLRKETEFLTAVEELLRLESNAADNIQSALLTYQRNALSQERKGYEAGIASLDKVYKEKLDILQSLEAENSLESVRPEVLRVSGFKELRDYLCLLYTSPSPRD